MPKFGHGSTTLLAYPVYAEKTQRGTGTVKEFTYIGLRQTGGVWSASQVEVKVRGARVRRF